MQQDKNNPNISILIRLSSVFDQIWGMMRKESHN